MFAKSKMVIAKEMRKDGKTFRQIGNALCVTHQRAQQLCRLIVRNHNGLDVTERDLIGLPPELLEQLSRRSQDLARRCGLL